jgi:hypothetical protein
MAEIKPTFSISSPALPDLFSPLQSGPKALHLQKDQMEKNISVVFPMNGTTESIVITYNISMTGNIQTIACCIGKSEHRNWLQLNKFDLQSQFTDGIYVALYNESLQQKNIATSLFIDQAYNDIMAREKMKVN